MSSLAWPTVEWKISSQQNTWFQVNDPLIAARNPAFLNFDYALAAFACSPQELQRSHGSEILIREQDRRARIDGIRISATRLIAELSGTALSGVSLTLSGEDGPTLLLSGREAEAGLPLSGPIATGSWLALHVDQELLDRRNLDPRWGGTKDVEFEVDATTRVELLISGGEGTHVEFKRQPPDDPQRFMKTIAAFANGDGGTLLFGVDDDGTIVGVDCSRDARDRLTSMIIDWVQRTPPFDLDIAEFEDGNVLVLDVPGGTDTPYGVGTKNREVTYYVRRQGTTFPATPSDIRGFVQARSVQSGPTFPFPLDTM